MKCNASSTCEGFTSTCSDSNLDDTEEACVAPATLLHEYGDSTDMICSDRSKITQLTCGDCDKAACSDATRQPDDCLYDFVQNTDLASAQANIVDLTITEQDCRDIQEAYDPSATFNVATNANGPRGCVKLAANTNYYYRASGAHDRTSCTTAGGCTDTSKATSATCTGNFLCYSGLPISGVALTESECTTLGGGSITSA